jgi:hypothetical protein
MSSRADNLIVLKNRMPKATVPDADQDNGPALPGQARHRAASYARYIAFCMTSNLMKPASIHRDRRKFEAELPNDLWQSDVIHGPLVDSEPRQRKSLI